MPTFRIPNTEVTYRGFDEVIQTDYFKASWGATITGDYLYDPYRFRITKVTLNTDYYCYNDISGVPFVVQGTTRATMKIRSRDFSGKTTQSVSISINLNGQLNYPVREGIHTKASGTWTGSKEILLPNSGGRFNGYVLDTSPARTNNLDLGNIYSTQSYPAWDPNNPGAQYWDGSAWTTHNIKRWDGSAWQDIPGRRWDGSSWQEVQG